jgi:hypothetical protein
MASPGDDILGEQTPVKIATKTDGVPEHSLEENPVIVYHCLVNGGVGFGTGVGAELIGFNENWVENASWLLLDE